MFTTIAFLTIAAIGWSAGRSIEKERAKSNLSLDDEVRQSVVHARQDIKLIAFILAAILIMLGVLVDVLLSR